MYYGSTVNFDNQMVRQCRYFTALHTWNDSSLTKRKEYLKAISSNAVFANRSFPFLPKVTRQNLIEKLNKQ